jgi:hypothetical protein
MAYDDNQISVPDSFVDLYRDSRQRLTAPKVEVMRQYEYCEDMAQALAESCRSIHFRDGVSEDEVLDRVYASLESGAPGIEPIHAGWVVRRTAELLGWPWAPTEAT